MTDFKIVEYDPIAEQIQKLKEMANFIPDASTKEGYEKSKRISLDVGKAKSTLEKARKDKKAYFITGGKEVDTQARAIKEKLDDIQLPHLAAYKLVDTIKKDREAERKRIIEERVETIRSMPEIMRDSSSSEIRCALSDLNKEDCDDFYEYTEQALKARNNSKTELAILMNKRKKEEDDALELEKHRRESAKREAEEREAEIKADQDKRVREAEEKAADKERDRAKKREQQLKDDIEAEKAAVQKAIDDAEEEKAKAIRRHEESKKAIARAEAAAKQAIIDTKKEAEKKAIDDAKKVKEEELKRAKNRNHSKLINNQAVTCLVKIEGVSKELAIDIVTAIAKKQIDNISIKY